MTKMKVCECVIRRRPLFPFVCLLVVCFFFLICSVRVVRAHNRHACLSHVSSIARVDVPMRLLLVYSQLKGFFSWLLPFTSTQIRLNFVVFFFSFHDQMKFSRSRLCVLFVCIEGFMRCISVYKDV